MSRRVAVLQIHETATGQKGEEQGGSDDGMVVRKGRHGGGGRVVSGGGKKAGISISASFQRDSFLRLARSWLNICEISVSQLRSLPARDVCALVGHLERGPSEEPARQARGSHGTSRETLCGAAGIEMAAMQRTRARSTWAWRSGGDRAEIGRRSGPAMCTCKSPPRQSELYSRQCSCSTRIRTWGWEVRGACVWVGE